MDKHRLNTYLNLIDALLRCPKGQEWLLIQQHEDIVDRDLLTVMERAADRLNAEGNVPAAQFLQAWAMQLAHLLERQTAGATAKTDRYLPLIQALLECSKGNETAILNQHLELMDEGLVFAMNQTAAQLAAQGRQDLAIYLKHLAADVNRILHPDRAIEGMPATAATDRPSSTPAPSGDEWDLDRELSAPAPAPAPSEGLLVELTSRLERLEILLSEGQTPADPLWYMPILERVDAGEWIISSEEVERLIGCKPHCEPGHNSFMRGCWRFVKAGKVGTHSGWRVVKEHIPLPSDLIVESKHPELESVVASPWGENSHS